MTSKMHVHQIIARALCDHGIDTMFGLMGDANLFMIDSFVRDCGARFVPAAHEVSSVLMALSYAHVSGKVGVTTVTHGPALTNCIPTPAAVSPPILTPDASASLIDSAATPRVS